MGQSRESKHIESPRGKGKIYDGDLFISECSYDLAVYQEIIVTEMHGPPDRVLGNVDITGVIKPVLDLWQKHSLHLADGRKLPFSFADPDGTIQINGLFTEPCGQNRAPE